MKRWHHTFVLTVVLVCCGCRGKSRTPDEHVLVASATLTSTWVRNFNPFSANALWPTQAGIYEPLMIYNTLTGQFVPWLATSYEWETPGKVLTFHIRSGVKWNDGTAFTVEDVAFTFELLRTYPALDTGAVWSKLAHYSVIGENQISFTLKQIDFTTLPFLAHQMIVQKAQWSSIADPVKFTNETPIGTGPYTEVETFRTQLFELGRNPHYWQQDAHLAKKLRMPAYAGNDTVSLALVSGEIDWAGHTLPRIDQTYVARDPKHFGYWFPPFGGMVFLFANTTRSPFDDVRVRKAISHAINRERLVNIGMSGYTQPAPGSGLSPTYAKWYCCQDQPEGPTRFDPQKTIELLNAAGCTQNDGAWYCDDKQLDLTLEVVNGWTDWIRTAQLIASDLGKIGIQIRVKTLDFGAWFDHVQRGSFDLSIGWSNEGLTPYEFYRDLTSSETRKPVGTASPVNWHRYADSTFDGLLEAFPRTPEGPEQKKIVNQLQREFSRQLPAIPLFPNPSWGTYSTRYFTGFPNADAPYAKLSPHANPERLLLMTRVKPRGNHQ